MIDNHLTGPFNVGRLSAAAFSQNDPDGDGQRGVIINNLDLHRAAQEIVLRRPGGAITPELQAILNDVILKKCDELDGVNDSVIQNPATCDFDPARDLPRCKGDTSGEGCFTPPQIDSVSSILTAVTDEKGKVIQPGMSVSQLQITTPGTDSPPDNDVLRIFAFGNDPEFDLNALFDFGTESVGEDYRTVITREKVTKASQATRMGTGNIPENAGKFIRQDRKMLIWHNLSDERLTPFISVNYYNKLAGLYGGYKKLQKNIRLFSLPGTGHCSMSGVGPTSFDALTAMEEWVEQDRAPNGLVAAKYRHQDFTKPPIRTMPLCKFPEMARYRGEGDVNHAVNWHCPQGDTSMLSIDVSGRRAGVILE